MTTMEKAFNQDFDGYVYIAEQVISGEQNHVSNVDVYNKDGVFYVVFDTNLQSFGVINRNQRSYTAKNIWECILMDKIQALLRDNGWFGEFNHPVSQYKDQKLSPERLQDVEPTRRAFKIMRPKIIGDLLQARIQSSQNQMGVEWGKEILAGWIPSFSCRAIATLQMIGGKPVVVVRRLITYDSVWYPSHPEAHAISAPKAVKKSIDITTESAVDEIQMEAVIIPLKEILESVGKTDVNTQMIMESFELPQESLIGFDRFHTHAIIKDDDNMIYANISPQTKRRVDHFFESLNI